MEPLPPARRDQIEQMLLDGVRTSQIAQLLGIRESLIIAIGEDDAFHARRTGYRKREVDRAELKLACSAVDMVQVLTDIAQDDTVSPGVRKDAALSALAIAGLTTKPTPQVTHTAPVVNVGISARLDSLIREERQPTFSHVVVDTGDDNQ